MLTPNGPGGRGSIPALVMRTGLIQPVNPANARRDITTQHVLETTMWPTDHAIPQEFLPTMPNTAQPEMTSIMPAPPSQMHTAVAQTVTATPPAPMPAAPTSPMPTNSSDQRHWHLQHRRMHPMVAEIRRLHPHAGIHGASVELGEWQGRPIAKFEIASMPPAGGAQAAAGALRRAAHILRQTGLSNLPPELVAGPLAALMRGGAVELHFQNGAAVRTAL